jgi:hypothetical protein
MASVFSENLRVYNAEQFKASVSTGGPTKIYLTVGKVDPWPNDAAPLQANSSVTVFNDVWKNMIGAKLITGNDVRHVVPRNDWESGTVYDAYDHCTCSILLFNANVKFFIVTSDWNVYKCLENNRGGPSLVMPTQTITNAAVEEIDGYVWKFMYNISAEERLRFTTDEYVPVRTLVENNNSLQWQVQEDAVPGAINSIKLTNEGNNYTSIPTITITGDGNGAAAVAEINVSSNVVERLIVTNPGSGYTFANVTFSGPGTGAEARAMISPPGGHGSDPLRELGGSSIIMNLRLNNNEDGKIPTDNDYRQVSILQDPRLRETNNIATNLVYSQTLRLTLSIGSSNYEKDEIVYQGPTLDTSYFRGRVVAWDSGNNILKLTNTTGIPQSDVVTGANTAVARFVESVTEKDLRDYSGNLLYVDNILPLQRADDQTDDFKIVFRF